MARLQYLDTNDTTLLIEVAGGLFPGTPAFHLSHQGDARLESALAVPRQPNYRTLPQKAAALQYHLSENHPFIDGNKRFSVAAMSLFLELNTALLLATDEKLVEVSLNVASHRWDKQDLIKFVAGRTLRLHWTGLKIQRWLAQLESQGDSDASTAWQEMLDDNSPDPLTLRVLPALAAQLESSAREG